MRIKNRGKSTAKQGRITKIYMDKVDVFINTLEKGRWSYRVPETMYHIQYADAGAYVKWIESIGASDFYTNLDNVAALRKMADYMEKYGQCLEYVYTDDHWVLFSTTQNRKYALPLDCVELVPYQDYSDTPVSLLGAQNELSGKLPTLRDDVTERSIKQDINRKQDEIKEALDQIEQQKKAQEEEIERMKAEIEARFAEKFEVLNRKKAELELKKEQLTNELFVLDTQIYGIRCYFGETVSFTTIVSGKDAPEDEPIVLHQKIRYLDEELAKWMSIYGFDGDDTGMFEQLLAARPDLRDFFFPGAKSISLVRISRDGKIHVSSYHASIDGTKMVYENIIKEYAVYHGTKIGILVRNGENCYIGWTDDDRISINDGNAFLTPKQQTIDVDAQVEVTDHFGRKKEREDVHTDKEEVASRYFLFSIMQGLIDNSKLITLPVGSNVTEHSPYVIYSMADSWLKDTTYGSLTDILQKYNGLIRKGDMLLTLSRLGAEGRKYESYSNDRGIGYRNRTHDVYAEDNMIYPANLTKNIPMKRYSFERRDKISGSDEYGEWETVSCLSKSNTFEKFYSGYGFQGGFRPEMQYRNVQSEDAFNQDVYISLQKDRNWMTGAESTANFLLYSDEYINLTFLNTDLIRYVLTNGDLGKQFSGRNLSSMLPYLNHMMDYLKKREAVEENLIRSCLLKSELPSDWRMKLSDWKMENDVHSITEYQAKRFAKTLENMHLKVFLGKGKYG